MSQIRMIVIGAFSALIAGYLTSAPFNPARLWLPIVLLIGAIAFFVTFQYLQEVSPRLKAIVSKGVKLVPETVSEDQSADN